MSGAINHIDNYQVAIGNTYLKPYTDYSAHLSYILKRKYIFRCATATDLITLRK